MIAEQEITNDGIRINIDSILKQIRKLPIPYHGNKKKLLFQINSVLNKHNIKFNSILDVFSGSGVVSLFFQKQKKKVFANDFLYSSCCNIKTLLDGHAKHITEKELNFILTSNEMQSLNKHFVLNNYLGTEYRSENKNCKYNKFTLKECEDLDRIRTNIQYLPEEKQAVIFAAIFAVVSRLPFGSIDQSNSILKHRKKQKEEYGAKDRRIGIYYDSEYNLKFDKWIRKYIHDYTLYASDTYIERPNITTMNASDALVKFSNHNIEAVYFDPPYGGKSADYANLYKFFEEYYFQNFIDNLEHIKKYKSLFISKESYENNFRELLFAAKPYPIWIFSYNSSSWTSIDDIVSIIKEYKQKTIIEELDKEYKYKYRKKNGNKKQVTEYLIIAQ